MPAHVPCLLLARLAVDMSEALRCVSTMHGVSPYHSGKLWSTVRGGKVMKRNLTVQLDEDVIQQAKVLAARRGTSVSTLVASELERLVADDGRYEDAYRRAQRALAGAASRGGRRWSRDDLYDR